MPNAAKPTDAQEDAIRRLEKRHGKISRSHFDSMGRLWVVLPGDEELRHRQRAITPSGVSEKPISGVR